jgi:hypothetical protein
VAGSCKHSNDPSGSKKGREFFDNLRDSYLLKDSVPWSELVSK